MRRPHNSKFVALSFKVNFLDFLKKREVGTKKKVVQSNRNKIRDTHAAIHTNVITIKEPVNLIHSLIVQTEHVQLTGVGRGSAGASESFGAVIVDDDVVTVVVVRPGICAPPVAAAIKL